MIVLDASAAVDLLLQTQPNGPLIAERLSRAGESLHTPAIFDAEVLQALRRYSLRKEISAVRARQAREDLVDLRITRYPYVALLERMWAMRTNISIFDAAYVALAEALGAPVITTDRKLRGAPRHRAQIETYP